MSTARRPSKSLLACLLATALAACQAAPPPPVAAPAPASFEGRYARGSQHLDITRRGDGYWLDIADDGAGSCTFGAAAIRVDDRLLASLQDWKSGAVLTLRQAGHGSLDVYSEQEDDRFSLAAFCRGDATLSGRYLPAVR